jgi:hypothetical protein
MDTNRFNIIKQNLSAGGVSLTDTRKAFAVVKAEKGPIEPVYIPASSPGLIYEILGYTSKEYPQIQEIIDVNASYGVFVSAPYSTAVEDAVAPSVPVAYVSPAGIFAKATPVVITGHRLEDVEAELDEIEGITSIETHPLVLVPAGKESVLFPLETTTTPVSEVLTYATSNLKINVGFNTNISTGEFSKVATTKIHVINNAAFDSDESRVLRMSSAVSGALGVLAFDIPGEESLVYVTVTQSAGTMYLADKDGQQICTTTADDGFVFNNSSSRSETISDLAAKYFSIDAITSLWSNETFRKSVKVYWVAELYKDAIKATIYPKYLSERITSLSFTKQKLGNTIAFTASESVTPSSTSSRSFTGSLRDTDVDGFGSSLSFKSVLEDQYLISIYSINPFESTTVYTATGTTAAPTMTIPSLQLQRGKRVVKNETLEAGWAEASAPELDVVDVFFAPYELPDNSEFFNVASSRKKSRFVFNKEVDVIGESTEQLSYGSSYVALTNTALRRSSFTREDYWSNLTGAYTSMMLSALDRRYGGAALMYLNDGDGLGGQLGVSVRRMRKSFSKDQLSYLDVANYNPVIKDPSYGLMVVGQKTCAGGELSDWSYVGHMSAFLEAIREAENVIMIPQLGKANNPYYRELREIQGNDILRKRTEGLSRIWAAAEASTSTTDVNTTAILTARKFAIRMRVKVDIFSEGVDLILINVDQSTEF